MSFKEEFEYSFSVLQRVHSKLYMSPEQQQQTAHSNLFNILCVLGSPLFGQLVDIDTSIKSSQLPHDRENDDAIVSHRNQVSDNGLRKHHCQKQEKQLQSEELHNLQVQQATIQRLANGRQTELIELFKPMDNVSLGFGVVGLYSETHGELGIYVQQIQPESLVARDGRLQENDQILAINNTVLNSTAGLSHQQAIHLLQTVTGHIRLIVAKGPQQSVTSSLSYSSNSSGSKTLISDVQRDSKPTSPAAVIAGGTNDPAGDMVLNTDFVQVEVITLVNDGSGLGFGIIGGKSTGVVVKTILPGGVAERDGRLHSGDHLLQIGEINVRGMGSEQVAAVLRQSGTHVHLIIARSIGEPADEFPPCAPVIPTHQLTDHLRQLNQALILHGEDYPGYIISPEDGLDAIVANGPVANLLLPAEIHQPPQADDIASHEVELFDVELAKGTVGLGITIAGYISDRPSDDLNGIFVRAIGEGSAAALDGRIQVHDQIVAVDGVLLEGYSNQKAVELLRGTGHIIHLKLARHRIGSRYMQMLQSTTSTQIDSINATAPAVVDDVCTIAIDSSYIEPSLIDISDVNNHYDDDIVAELPKDIEDGLISKWQPIVGDNFSIVVAEVVKFKEGGGLGISLEGTVDVENGLELHPHHYIRSVLADGPVGLSGKLEPGDELLQVNESVLYGRNHIEVVSILKELPRHVRVICARRSTSSSATEYNTASCGSDVLRHSLFKAKSEQVLPLAAGTSAAGSVTAGTAATAAAATAGVGLSLRDTMVSGWGQQLNTVTKARSLEPLSAISMWASDVVTIELYKAERGLGFSILDYQDPIDPSQTVIVIRSLVPGGVAQVDGRLVPGDRLLFVNDVNLENASLDKAVQTLKSAPKGPVTIGVAKPLPFPELADLSMDNLLMYDNQSARHCGGTGSLLVCSPSVVSEPSLNPSGTDGYLLMNSRVPPASTSVLPSVDQRGQDVLSNVTTANDSRISSSVACERTIVIEKGADTLGLVVETMDRGVNGCIVKTLVESEAVARDGRIQVGDYIVGVNNDSLRRVTNAQARAVLRKASLHNSDISITYIPAADVSQFNDTWCKQSTDGVNATSTADRKISSSGLICSSTVIPATAVERRRSSLEQYRLHQQQHVALRRTSLDQTYRLLSTAATPASGSTPRGIGPSKQSHMAMTSSMSLSTSFNEVIVESVAQEQQQQTSHSDIIADAEALYGCPLPGVVIRTTLNISTPINRNVQQQVIIQHQEQRHHQLGLRLSGCVTANNGSGTNTTCSDRGDNVAGVFIAGLVPDTVASRNDLLRVGDQILQINDIKLLDCCHLQVPTIINSMTTDHYDIILLRRYSNSAEQNSISPPQVVPVEDLQKCLTEDATHSDISTPQPVVSTAPAEAAVASDVNAQSSIKTPDTLPAAATEAQNSSSNSFCQPSAIDSDVNLGEYANDRKLSSATVEYINESPCVQTGNAKSNCSMLTDVIDRVPDNNNKNEDASRDSVTNDVTIVNDDGCVPQQRRQQLQDTTVVGVENSEIKTKSTHNNNNQTTATTDAAKTVVPPVEKESKSSAGKRKGRSGQRSQQQNIKYGGTHTSTADNPATCQVVAGRETVIEIDKRWQPLGISVIGGSNTLLGSIVVNEIFDGGVAQKDGRLRVGDQLLEVNGEDFRQLVTDEWAMEVLHQSSGKVKLTVYRDDSPISFNEDNEVYEIFTIDLLKKPGKGLGFSITGRQHEAGSFVSDVIKGGVADLDGQLVPGDQILVVNGNNVRNSTQQETAALLKTLIGRVSLTIGRVRCLSRSSSSSSLSVDSSKSGPEQQQPSHKSKQLHDVEFAS